MFSSAAFFQRANIRLNCSFGSGCETVSLNQVSPARSNSRFKQISLVPSHNSCRFSLTGLASSLVVASAQIFLNNPAPIQLRVFPQIHSTQECSPEGLSKPSWLRILRYFLKSVLRSSLAMPHFRILILLRSGSRLAKQIVYST